MTRPFELGPEELESQLDKMVDATFSDLQSQFLILPKKNLIEYADFQGGYEVLKGATDSFRTFSEETVWSALIRDSLALVVLRTILGVSPGEWADLAKTETRVDVSASVVRLLDVRVRLQRDLIQRLEREGLLHRRLSALVHVAVDYISRGAPEGARDTVHRLAKVDTSEGLRSLQHVAGQHVPYAVLLYERYLGRPFASYRDSVSEYVGDVMESAIEERLGRAQITFRKTKRAERVPGFKQAPDFFVPTEFAPSVIVEAKIAGDDGTARDKVTRILQLANIRDEKVRAGEHEFQVVACIDGRGFGIRRADMKQMLRATGGKVFTLATLDHLIPWTKLREFLPTSSPETERVPK